MVFTDLYINLTWHIILCVIALIFGLWYLIAEGESGGWIAVIVAIVYFLFAPYGKVEEIRNCRTEKGKTVSIIVKFKEPIVKFLWQKPTDVKVTSVNGNKKEIKLQKSTHLETYNGTVFEGNYYDGKENDTLILIL